MNVNALIHPKNAKIGIFYSFYDREKHRENPINVHNDNAKS